MKRFLKLEIVASCVGNFSGSIGFATFMALNGTHIAIGIKQVAVLRRLKK